VGEYFATLARIGPRMGPDTGVRSETSWNGSVDTERLAGRRDPCGELPKVKIPSSKDVTSFRARSRGQPVAHAMKGVT
jgi:hypothetical protein